MQLVVEFTKNMTPMALCSEAHQFAFFVMGVKRLRRRYFVSNHLVFQTWLSVSFACTVQELPSIFDERVISVPTIC